LAYSGSVYRTIKSVLFRQVFVYSGSVYRTIKSV
jgi:hypothetical protein